MRFKREYPPRPARRLLRLLAGPDDSDDLGYDVDEEYNDLRERRGRLAAGGWIWFQIVVSLPSFIKNYLTWRQTMLANYLRTAWRNFKKHGVFSFLNIAGLAVGMACAILIFLWIRDELGFDKFHPEHERLYRAVSKQEGRWADSSAWALAPTLKKDFAEIPKATRFANRNVFFQYEDRNLNRRVAFVDSDFFDMFGFPLRKGDPRTALEVTLSAVLTESAAKALFGTVDPVGKALRINNSSTAATVTGVIADPPRNSTLEFEVLMPVKLLNPEADESWATESECYVLLDRNASLEEVRKKIAPVIMNYDRRISTQRTLDLQPMTRMHLYDLNGAGPILYVYIFATTAAFILLMACINFMNLATARAGTRAKEVGLRKVVGARTADIARQYYGESLFYAGLSLLAAIGLVLLTLPAFNRLSGKSLSLSGVWSWGVALFLLGVTFFTGLVSGSYPAHVLSAFHPAKTLKAGASTGRSKSGLRRILVVAQFSISVVLIIGTAAVFKQLNFIRTADLGFNRQQVLSLPMYRALLPRYKAFKDEILKESGVVNVTAANSLPTWTGNVNPVTWEGRDSSEQVFMNFVATDYDYIKTFEMKIAAGRDFSMDFPADQQNYIVNEAAVRKMGIKDPLGKTFAIWDNKGVIIGIVKDFHNRPLSMELTPTVITLLPNWNPAFVFVRIQPGNIRGTLDRIGKIWSKFAPSFPFQPAFLDESFEELYQSDKRLGALFRNFAVLAIFISCLGIFGLAAFSAQQRTKEIGVRKVLGASVGRIVRLLSREFLILVTIANAIAIPLGYFLTNRLLRSYAYRTTVPAWMFAAAAILAYIVALSTAGFQAFKAARAEPTRALKYE